MYNQEDQDLMSYEPMTIAPKTRFKIERHGDYVRLRDADGPLELFLNGQGCGPIEDNGGYNGNIANREFGLVEFYNPDAVSTVTASAFVGSGEMFNNNINIGGTVQIENALGDKLDVDDVDTQIAIAALGVKLDTLDASLTAIKTAIKSPTINLDGCIYVDSANVDVTVSAVTNANGAFISLLSYAVYGFAQTSGLEVDGNFITPTNANGGTGVVKTLTNIEIPAGVAFVFKSNNVNTPIRAAYTLL